jgi:hypothetical protein
MADDDRESKKAAFRILHNPEGLLYRLAHARRTNTSEPYDGAKLKAIYDRVVDEHVRRARGVLDLLRTRSPRPRD